MKFKKGDLLNINHSRHGLFKAIAVDDFDTEDTIWFPVKLAPGENVRGASRDWIEGENISCRDSHVSLILKEETLSED